MNTCKKTKRTVCFRMTIKELNIICTCARARGALSYPQPSFLRLGYVHGSRGQAYQIYILG